MIKILFIALGLVAAWFVGVAGVALYCYGQLDQYGPCQIKKWQLIEYSPSKVALEAFYTFSAKGKEWQGQMIFSKPYYLNLPSAQVALKEKEKRVWGVWYNHKNPSVSSLEKNFPYKHCFNALIVLGLAGYFWILKDKLIR